VRAIVSQGGDERPPGPERATGTRRRLRLLVVLGVVAVLVGAGLWALVPTGRDGGAEPFAAPLVGTPAPALAGPTLSGGRLDLVDLRGQVVLVNVWAAWCAPCRDELPVLSAAGRRLADRGLRWVGIDSRDGERQARELLAATGGDPASSVVDPDGRLAAAWRVPGLPATFVVDRAGTVRAARLGVVTEEWIEAEVVPLLGPPAGG
jgi:cytochrome c biogenesis protein CcmG, thiol:disulfide interchange protein DsbE